MGARYAATPGLTINDIAAETQRTYRTVRDHADRLQWGRLRREYQAKTRDSILAKMQEEQERFAIKRHRRMLRIADRATKALFENLAAPAGEEGFGSNKVDGYQLQAILKTLDDGTLVGKVAAQITPILFEQMDREAIEKLIAERRASTQKPLHHGTNGTTTSTPKQPSADARVASLFSRRNGTS